ncbi:MAG: 4-hydroxyphenylpyruvate dioxygenase [Pseudomonadales bacterium]|nr:4-hydroxyphenylpyruvate dioxygenase [Pseudomonadales bacterium]
MNNEQNYVDVLDFSFLEFSGPSPNLLEALFDQLEFKKVGSIKANAISLFKQGDVLFISNPSYGGHAEYFRSVHTRGASAMGFRVSDADKAYALAISLGADTADFTDYDLPAIKGVGASLIYFIDDENEEKLFSQFGYTKQDEDSESSSLKRIDHLTHNLNVGGIKRVAGFYERIFGFKSERKFDINGKKTGLLSEVITSDNGRVIIPLNETKDDESQIAEFIKEYNGEGIQHIALSSNDLYSTIDTLADNGVPFQDTPNTYYEMLDHRIPEHGESVDELRNRKILLDGGEAQGGGLLLQIFTKNSIGPIFFEFIQRKGNNGFGEGNFQALFESIELDQERRGILS